MVSVGECMTNIGTFSGTVNECGGTASVNFSPDDTSNGYSVSYITSDNEASGGCNLPSIPGPNGQVSCSS